jgi:hypothetical protein
MLSRRPSSPRRSSKAGGVTSTSRPSTRKRSIGRPIVGPATGAPELGPARQQVDAVPARAGWLAHHRRGHGVRVPRALAQQGIEPQEKVVYLGDLEGRSPKPVPRVGRSDREGRSRVEVGHHAAQPRSRMRCTRATRWLSLPTRRRLEPGPDAALRQPGECWRAECRQGLLLPPRPDPDAAQGPLRRVDRGGGQEDPGGQEVAVARA